MLTERLQFRVTVLAIAVGIAIAAQSGRAAVKTRVDFEKSFDFKQARTWAWNAAEAGRVMVARTPDDDPEVIQRRAEPIIMSAVSAEMPGRGLKPATGAPDLQVTYYLLLTLGSSAQTLGQFLPPVTEWGIPPFRPATTALEVIEEGSLVLDLSANGQVVWRGIGEAQIKMGLPQDKRAALIREAVREILKRYPPRR
jgi:hypothetical protein